MDKNLGPYKLSWMDDTSIPMKQQCLIALSLGKHYTDTIHCDVIPIKACHLLLGRPWLYDRKIKYDTFKIRIPSCLKTKKIILQPIKIYDNDAEKY